MTGSRKKNICYTAAVVKEKEHDTDRGRFKSQCSTFLFLLHSFFLRQSRKRFTNCASYWTLKKNESLCKPSNNIAGVFHFCVWSAYLTHPAEAQ